MGSGSERESERNSGARVREIARGSGCEIFIKGLLRSLQLKTGIVAAVSTINEEI